jgi:hypothetical protein
MSQKPDSTSSLEDAVKGDLDNYPGAAYVDRVAGAIGRAWTSQTKEMNEAWSDIRNGRFGIGRAMQMWARTIETSYDVLVEVAEGPASSPRPAWLVIPYNPDKPEENRASEYVYKVKVEGPSEPSGRLDYSKFIGVAENAYDLYVSPPVREGTQLEFRLKEDELKLLQPDTDYISFIFREGQGAAPPLAIIVVRVRGDRNSGQGGNQRIGRKSATSEVR